MCYTYDKRRKSVSKNSFAGAGPELKIEELVHTTYEVELKLFLVTTYPGWDGKLKSSSTNNFSRPQQASHVFH
jgi:hypothetical protein